MNSPTPEAYISDFLEDKKRTYHQKDQIWDESYQGRRISWCGRLRACSFIVEGNAEVDIGVKGGERLVLFVKLLQSEKETMLSFHVGDYVRVTGELNGHNAFSHIIDVIYGCISRA